jgi:hypothetical protein
MASPRESVEQHRDAIPGRVRVVARVLRCQSIKCSYTGAGAWTTCVQVPSSEADLARGGVEASSEAGSARGSVYPSSEADPARGGIRRATLAGCVGHPGRDRVVCFRFVG